MKITDAYPPNYEELKKYFDFSGKNAIFCYGDTIYNPWRCSPIRKDSIVHEEVHSKQQEKIGGPDIWWDNYINDLQFRCTQEAEAYGAQLKYIRRHFSLLKAVQALHSFATSLSGPVYGRPCSYEDAKKTIYKQSILT